MKKNTIIFLLLLLTSACGGSVDNKGISPAAYGSSLRTDTRETFGILFYADKGDTVYCSASFYDPDQDIVSIIIEWHPNNTTDLPPWKTEEIEVDSQQTDSQDYIDFYGFVPESEIATQYTLRFIAVDSCGNTSAIDGLESVVIMQLL